MSDATIIEFPGAQPSAASSISGRKKAVGASNMRSDLVERAREVITDPPILINMVSQRVRQLNNGRPPLIRVISRMGQADIALQEIIEGKIVLVDEEVAEA